MHGFPTAQYSRKILWLVLLLACSSIWAQKKVAGPPTLQQLQAQEGEPIEDDPWARHLWMRERFSGEPLDYKDMMLRETQRQNQLYPQLAAGIQQTSPTPTWVSIGPTNANFETNGVTLNVVDSGRARTILPDPADTNTVYFLTSGGGLWKTTNFLQTNPTWVPKTDNLPTTGGGSVAFGRTSNILYLGLGDPFDDFPLAGGFVTTSTNGGDTWGAVTNLANATSVRDIKVDTSGASDIVMVATDAGFFRSTNAGLTYDSSPNASFGGLALWSLAKTSAGWLASAIDGGNNGSLWLSQDQGATWNQTGAGFTGAGRTTLGIGLPGDGVVYAFAATAGNGTQLDLFRSSDGGQSWTALNITSKSPTNPNIDQSNMNLMDGQAFYNQMILVDPTDVNRNTVYLGGNLSTARTTDGGNTWTLVTNWLPRGPITLPYAHADFHAAAISALTNPAKLFFGSDGGLFVSNDGGSTWDYRKNVGIVSHLVYALTTNPNSPNSTIVGLQDNGTRVRESNTTIYDQTRGGDGFGVGTSQANTNWTLSTYVHGAVDNSTNLGANWATANSGINTGDTPFATAITNPLASADPNGTVFFTVGNHDIYETTNGANSWGSIGSSGSGGISAGQAIRALVHVVGVSPVDTNHIAVAGTGGVLLLTANGGASWTQVPLNSAVPGYQSSNTNIAWVNNSILYVCSEAPFTGAIRVVKSVDGGNTWSAANNGLPDVSVSKLQIDPRDGTGNTVYAGTFIGVYQTTNGGASWQKFGAGLPNVHVTDIYMPPDGSFIRISTYGRGIWEINPPPAATHLLVTAPGSATAGTPISVMVTAQDATNTTVPSYTGTVHFTSSDGQAILPADYTFVAGDNGVHTFSVTLGTPGSQTVTATDAGNAISGTSSGITVSPGATNHFNVTGAPASIVAGNAFNITVTAKDSFDNTTTSYAGTVGFASGDSQAVLPGNSTLTNGVGTFSVTLKTAGPRTVIATDTVNGGITGSSSTVNVTNAIASKYSLTSPPTATANVNFTIRLVAQDQFNNTATNYTGTAHFTTSDAAGGVVVPTDYLFVAGDNGQKTFNPGFTLQTLGAQTITAADKSNGSITITNNITVTSDAFITPQGRTIHIFRANIPVVVASFTDADLAETGSNYTVSINWGDGSPPDTGCTLSSTNCKIVRASTNPNVFNVIGAHTYKKKGGLTVQVSLTDSGGSKADAFSTARFFPINSSH